MAFELVFSEWAEEDAKHAIYHYDQINPDLGNRFFEELIAAYRNLSTHPQYYSFINTIRETQIRDVKLPSFPYVVIFKIDGERVYIIAVRNTSQRPLFEG